MGTKDEAPAEEEVPVEEESSVKTPPVKEEKKVEGKKYDGGPIPRP